MLYVSALFAVVLTPVVNSTAKPHFKPQTIMGRGLAIVSLLVIMVAAIAIFGFLTIPPVAHDLNQLNGQAPERVPQMFDRLRRSHSLAAWTAPI